MSSCAEYSKRYRERHPERAKAAQARWREANREKIAAKNRAYRAAYPEKHREHCKKYYEANKDKVRAYQDAYWDARPGERKAKYQRYRANNLEKVRTKQLTKYGITQQDYERMSTNQGHACWICRVEAKTERNGVLHVDHDHDTGEVRGLLCTRCNSGLGMFRDNDELLIKALRYLEAARDA